MKKLFAYTALLLMCVTFLSCNRSGSGEDVIAYVNKEPIFSSEVQQSLSRQTRQDPFFEANQEAQDKQLDLIIDKKLIIQQAIEDGLAREEGFVDTIKAYWEQTLIREFLDHKKKEFSRNISVSENEINDYYHRLSKRVTFKVFKSKDKRIVEKVFKKVTQSKNLIDEPWETLGPFRYEDITSEVLLKAFDSPIGDILKNKEDDIYYIVVVIDKSEVPMNRPLESIRADIERRVASMKEQRMFNEWMNRKKSESRIRILKK